MMIGLARGNSLVLYYQVSTFCILALFALYDIRYHKIRDVALLCFLPWCLLSLTVQGLSTGLPALFLLMKACFGFLNGGLILFLITLATHGGIGGGDIKLTALLGLICGTIGICILLTAAALTALIFLFLQSARSGKQKMRLPFAPFLLIGFLIVWLI